MSTAAMRTAARQDRRSGFDRSAKLVAAAGDRPLPRL